MHSAKRYLSIVQLQLLGLDLQLALQFFCFLESSVLSATSSAGFSFLFEGDSSVFSVSSDFSVAGSSSVLSVVSAGFSVSVAFSVGVSSTAFSSTGVSVVVLVTSASVIITKFNFTR